jgi:hypothetical protein
MCQAVSEGGRRCPVHQHQNIAAIRAAEHLSGLTRLQTERLFAELRREGRNSEPLTNRLHAGSIRRIRNSVADTPVAEAVAADLERSATHDPQIDPASAYAQRALRERAVERGQKLQQRFQEVASRTGYSVQEVAAKYKEFREAVDTSRGSDVPPEYDQNTRRAAVISNLPYDRASVVALVKLESLVPAQEGRRVTLTPAPEGSHIHSYGYDDGRMEVVFNSNTERIYAYQNVPENLWERFSTTDSPGRVFAREIRGNEDYAYTSEEEAEADAHRVRCAACGQFRAMSHSCPEREVRAELSTVDITADQVAEIAPDRSTEPVPVEVEELNVVTPSEPEPAEVEVEVQPEPVRTTTPRSYIVPAAHIPAQDLAESAEPVEISDLLSAGTNIITPIAEPVNLPSLPTTAAQQRFPEAFDKETLFVTEVTARGYASYPTGTAGERRSWVTWPDEIIEAPVTADYVYGRDVERTQSENQILASYDNRAFFNQISGTYVDGSYISKNRIYRKGRLPVKRSFTRDEHRREQEEQAQMIAGLVESGEAVAAERQVSMTRKYKIDGNRATNIKLKVTSMSTVKHAIQDNKVVIIPITTSGAFNEIGDNYVDDQGFNIERSYNADVSGQIAVRRNAEGVMEVISTERTLQCNCHDYRQNYHCEHVNYIQRHAGNLAQQLLPETAAERRQRLAAVGRDHALMTTALSNRQDTSVIEPENGEAYVSFGQELTADNIKFETSTTWATNGVKQRLVIPARFQIDHPERSEAAHEQTRNLYKYFMMARELRALSVPQSPAAIRTALKQSNVEVPVKIVFANNTAYQAGTVTGTLQYKKASVPEESSVVSSNLKCTCPAYVANSDCEHVRFAKEQHLAVLGAGSRLEATGGLVSYAHSGEGETRFGNAEQLANRMARTNTSYEEAAEWQSAEIERQRVEAERIAEENRVRQERIQAERIIASRAAAERLRAFNRTTVEEHAIYRERMLQRWNTVEEPYSENPTAFYEDYKAAQVRKAGGEAPIPFRTENVTDGICANEPGGRSFGIELEFDIKTGVDKASALRAIGRELHAAGLTQEAQQTRYHSAARSGWASWSFEQDSTVSGELVSPIMKDTPEHWEQLRKATEIITRNGGVATTRTGSHVHVSTGSYEQSTAKHAELLRTVNNNEDLMYRLASNPATGRHRRGTWCQPNIDDNGDQFISHEIQDGHSVLGRHTSHNYALNFEGTANSEFKKSHVEFRMWDGTLDPAVIQQQVMISAALTDHAERNVIANNGSTKPAPGDRIKIGAGKTKEAQELTRASTRTHTEETFKESTAHAAKFLDQLFRKKEDRAAAASLFAVTNWQS